MTSARTGEPHQCRCRCRKVSGPQPPYMRVSEAATAAAEGVKHRENDAGHKWCLNIRQHLYKEFTGEQRHGRRKKGPFSIMSPSNMQWVSVWQSWRRWRGRGGGPGGGRCEASGVSLQVCIWTEAILRSFIVWLVSCPPRPPALNGRYELISTISFTNF